MRRVFLTGITLLAGALQPIVAIAEDESAAASFIKCARIAGDAQRLLCYDRLATELIELGMSARGGMPAVPAAPAEPAPSAGSQAAAPAAAQTVTPAPAVAAPAPAPTPAPAPQTTTGSTAQTGSAADDFGIETMEKGIARNVDRIESRYVGSFDGWSGDTVFELENGQVWQQSQSGRLVYRAENPKVVIKRGMLGGYYLSVDDVNRRVRVKRIK